MAALVLMTAAWFAYGFLLDSGRIPYSPYSDNVAYSLRAKETLYRAVQRSEGIPFLQRGQVAGGPALTNPQSLYTYPLHLLFYLLPPTKALGPTLWLHLLAAGASLYLLAAALGLGLGARLFVGVAGVLNFKLMMAVYAGWLPILPSLVLSPLLVASVVYLVRRPDLGRGLLFAGTAALCLHAGHLQLLYYTTLFLVVYLCIQGIQWLRRGERQRMMRVLGFVCAGSVLALGSAAYLLLPMLLESPLVTRSQASYEFFLSNHATSWADLATLFRPEALGTSLDRSFAGIEMWEDVAFFGTVPIVLAVVGAAFAVRDTLSRVLLAAFVGWVWLSMDTFATRVLFDTVPGFALFHCPSRMLFLASFAGILLAGSGWEHLERRLRSWSQGRWLPAFVLGALLVLMAVEAEQYARRYITMLPTERAFPETEYQHFLSEDETIHRVASQGRLTVNYGWAEHLGLELISGYEPYHFQHYEELFNLLTTGNPAVQGAGAWLDLNGLARPDLLNVLNVKYLLSSEPLRLPQDQFESVAHWESQPVFRFYRGLDRRDLFLYRNTGDPGRVYWARDVVSAESREQAVSSLQEQAFDGQAIVEGAGPGDAAKTSSDEGSEADRLEVTQRRQDSMTISMRNNSRRYLCISEVWHPGWRASLDGESLGLHRTNVAMLGAWIPPGEHQLQLSFVPPMWTWGVSITAASLLVMVLGTGFWIRRRRVNVATVGSGDAGRVSC